ncbi:uncharacterized protein LOC115371973 [Myripristis murdjan]|uniref:uncharacterized protein LOC115371973 n=1 Tax=Myripristis murdjan TaxID=586833 RepID=UPI0011760AAC|nr:uncharacterized protein LOC115371973 [Myripristis murdjan]XP_029925502.1 uncharacterized protein LOC115371973 [Myripristis murdjan]XP_029925503.1 uncharacterized protein LOC115371973 [Myripristis murdjan]
MDRRVNKRGFTESFFKGAHLKLRALKMITQGRNRYLRKENIPKYPRPEFHVSYLRHDTGRDGLIGIAEDSGFRAPYRDEDEEDPEDPETMNLIWWSLSVGPDEVDAAEERLLENRFPYRTVQQAISQESFLWDFASSPAFKETSRFGSYRFTFPVQELLDAYSEQLCDSMEPVLRVYDTVLYKQEVMYSVLVHSEDYNYLFEDYPLLTDSPDEVCAYEDGTFIWRSEAMSQHHRFKLVEWPYYRQMGSVPVSRRWSQYYVWDNVAVAFHMAGGQSLNFDMYQLGECLTFCERGYPTIPRPGCSADENFDSFEDAEEIVEYYWPDSPFN